MTPLRPAPMLEMGSDRKHRQVSTIAAPARRAAIACTAVVALGSASLADAGAIAQLEAFLRGTASGTATFRQVVIAKGQRSARESSGTFAFQRPGKFRWAYEAPFEQLVVGDGAKLWIYDRDLNQVIVRKLDLALGQSPAALLAGDNALEQNFVLAEDGTEGGLEYVVARPRASEAGFERVRIGFRDNLPRAMELVDAFGNLTTLSFLTFERNPPLDRGQFAFVPPKGADVVGE